MTERGPDAPGADPGAARATGTLLGVLAYGLWGLFPIYFHALEPTGAFEILAHRIVWSCGLVAVLLAIRGDHTWIATLRRTPRQFVQVTVAALCIGTNWLVYVWAVEHDRVLEAALGYFVNPLITVALGVFALGEHLRKSQWAACGLGAASVAVLTVAYGHVPVIALTLALTFAAYGFIKKTITLGPLESLAAETVVLLPVALGVLGYLITHGTLEFGRRPGLSLALASAGVVTTVPLVAFAGAAQRIPLSLLGLLQYLTPAAQFLTAVVVFHEPMGVARWIGFGLIWCALWLLSIDALRRLRGVSSSDEPLDAAS